jgi:hypothetical protein
VKGNNGEALDNDATHNVADGQTVDYLPYGQGFSCSAHEGAIPPTNACGNGTPNWTTTYATQPVAMTPAGETITVTNTLNCQPVIIKGNSTFSVSKEATFKGQPITNITFPMNVTCAHGGPSQAMNLAHGQVQSMDNLAAGTACTVVEGTIPSTGLCPSGTVEKWNTTYAPANGSNTTSAQSSVIVRVTNLLSCQPVKQQPVLTEPPVKSDTPIIIVPPPPPVVCDAATAQYVNGACRCTIQGQVPVSKTACACPNGQQLINGRCGNPPPKCEGNTHFEPALGKCVPNTPDCKPGTHLAPDRLRCVPDKVDCPANTHIDQATGMCVDNAPRCTGNTHLDPNSGKCVQNEVVCPNGTHKVPGTNRCERDRPTCQDGQQYDPRRNVCFTSKPVCPRGTHYEAGSNSCVQNKVVCGRGQKLDPATNRCVTVRPVCEPPMVYNPRNNRCVMVEQPCPRGTIKLRGVCLPIPHIQIPFPRGPKQQQDVPHAGTSGGVGVPGIKLPGF